MLPSGVNFFRQSKAADNQVGGWFCVVSIIYYSYLLYSIYVLSIYSFHSFTNSA